MKRKPESEPSYKRWTAVATVVIAVASLAFNVWQAIRNGDLTRKLQERQASPDLESRYFVVSGMPMFDVHATEAGDSTRGPRILSNKVLQALGPWRDRWESGEAMTVSEDGVERAHGLLLYRISNRGKEAAERVVLVVRTKEFRAEGEQGADVWSLRPTAWRVDTLRLADLRAGESVLVPLAHLLGTHQYFGTVVLPIEVQWYNPVLQRAGKLPAAQMAPEEQWLSQGLNVRVAQ